jgi:hypothetical protein
MQDIQDVLRTLPHATTAGPTGPDVAAADVARGHRALNRQRHRRIAFSGAALAVVAAVGVAVGLPAGAGSTTHPAAAGSGTTTQLTKVQLEAYRGAQPVGFRVSIVPAGWQVISSDRSSFVVALPGASPASSQPDPAGGGQAAQQAADQGQQHGTGGKPAPRGDQGVSFVGRIVVMLQGLSTMPSNSPLTRVNINGREGVLGFAEGGAGSSRSLWLIFPDAKGHKVLVQIPASVGLTNDQIVSFAQGITVTSAAVAAGG